MTYSVPPGTPASPAGKRAPVRSGPEAALLIRELGTAMDAFTEILDRETDLVRAGKLKAAGALAEEKRARADAYVVAMMHAKSEAEALGRFAPTETAAIRKRHHLFKANLQINMAVLATAHEIAQDLMRAVAREVETLRRPAVYSAPGHASRPSGTGGHGIAIDRSL